MKLKICGVRRTLDIEYLNKIQPDYAGFIFASSHRRVSSSEAKYLAKLLRPEIKSVGVFVNEAVETMIEITKQVGLSVVQLHGHEAEKTVKKLREKLPDSVEIWRAVRLKRIQDIQEAEALLVDRLLIDAYSEKSYGGTGEKPDWLLLQKNRPKLPFFLAGGLHSDNLKQAIEIVKPNGIDISSGVETDGWKDLDKMKRLKDLMKG